MTWPTQITITDQEQSTVRGTLTLQLNVPLTDSDSGAGFANMTFQARYNSAGLATLTVPVIDDPTTEPTGAWYTVTKRVTGAPTIPPWIIQPELSMAPSVALGSITPSTPLPPVLPYATSISVGTTTTGAPGSQASVLNAGTTQVPVFDFTIPAGAQGGKGDTGATGATGPTGATGAQGPSGTNAVVFALTDAASILTDASKGNVFTVTLGGNRTLANPTNPTAGQKMVWRITQDSTGSRTLAFGTAFRFSTSVPQPTLTTTPGKTDYIGAIYNAASSTWDVVAVSQGY